MLLLLHVTGADWLNETNLRARVADGVVALSHASPPADWAERVRRLRVRLPRTVDCLETSHS